MSHGHANRCGMLNSRRTRKVIVGCETQRGKDSKTALQREIVTTQRLYELVLFFKLLNVSPNKKGKNKMRPTLQAGSAASTTFLSDSLKNVSFSFFSFLVWTLSAIICDLPLSFGFIPAVKKERKRLFSVNRFQNRMKMNPPPPKKTITFFLRTLLFISHNAARSFFSVTTRFTAGDVTFFCKYPLGLLWLEKKNLIRVFAGKMRGCYGFHFKFPSCDPILWRRLFADTGERQFILRIWWVINIKIVSPIFFYLFFYSVKFCLFNIGRYAESQENLGEKRKK